MQENLTDCNVQTLRVPETWRHRRVVAHDRQRRYFLNGPGKIHSSCSSTEDGYWTTQTRKKRPVEKQAPSLRNDSNWGSNETAWNAESLFQKDVLVGRQNGANQDQISSTLKFKGSKHTNPNVVLVPAPPNESSPTIDAMAFQMSPGAGGASSSISMVMP